MKSTLILPTLNEIEAVKIIIPQINRKWVDQILVVDGGSTDGTIDFMKKRKFEVFSQKGRGYGTGIKEALEHAKGDVVVEFTPDGNSVPEKIPELIKKVEEGYDLVVGSRYREGAKSEDDTAITGFGNGFFTRLANLLFQSHYTDLLVGLHAYRRESYEKVKDRMTESGLSWCGQMALVFWKNKFRVAEIPADEPKRIGGKAKRNSLKTGWLVLKMILRERFGK